MRQTIKVIDPNFTRYFNAQSFDDQAYSEHGKLCQEYVRERVLTVLSQVSVAILGHKDFDIKNFYRNPPCHAKALSAWLL